MGWGSVISVGVWVRIICIDLNRRGVYPLPGGGSTYKHTLLKMNKQNNTTTNNITTAQPTNNISKSANTTAQHNRYSNDAEQIRAEQHNPTTARNQHTLYCTAFTSYSIAYHTIRYHSSTPTMIFKHLHHYSTMSV